MANSSIDRVCACHIGLHTGAGNSTCSISYNNEIGECEHTELPYTRPLAVNCTDFSDISSCLFVSSCDDCRPAHACSIEEHHGPQWCAHFENTPSAPDIWADCDSVALDRFIMGDDNCVKESENNRSVSIDSDNTDSENTDSGNTDSGNTDSGNTDSGNTDIGNTDSGNTDSGNTDSGNTDIGNTDIGNIPSGSLLENYTGSGDSAENYLNIYAGYRNRDSRGDSHDSRRDSHVDSGIVLENLETRTSSAQNSLDSNVSMTSDNVFLPGSSVMDSISDVTSISSMSSCQSAARDTITSRMRFELRHGNHLDGEANDYMTPSQRKDRELKDLRKERAQLLREQQEKEVEIAALRACLETVKTQLEEKKVREMAELVEKLKVSEREKFEEMEELCRVQEELSKMDVKYTDLKKKLSEKEEMFQEYLFDMYKKGQLAAMFEREQELEMLASSQKARVSVRELTRKLSRTELELAKWQGLKLQESYSVTDRPQTQAEATLSFLKDSFFHFITSKSDSEDHLRAMITIFNYSDMQMAKIRKGLEDFKRLDRKRLSLK
ncbi:hypothetical protein BsWGS_14468 [Bradybaena similaris]